MSRQVVGKPMPGKPTEIGRNLFAEVKNGKIIVVHKGKVIFEGSAEVDYELHRTQGNIEVRPLNPPRGSGGEFLGWLCGAPRKPRVTSIESYDDAVRKYKKTHKKVKLWEVEGEGYKFFWSQKYKPGSRPFCVAYFISKDITVPAILTMIPMMRKAGYADNYIKQLLEKKYDVTEELLRDALNNSDL